MEDPRVDDDDVKNLYPNSALDYKYIQTDE